MAVRELFSVTRFSKIKVRLFRNVTQQTVTGAAGQVQMGMAAFGVRPLIDLIYTLPYETERNQNIKSTFD